MLIKRILSALCLILLSLSAIIYKPLFVLIAIVLTFCGLKEFFALVEVKGLKPYKYFGILIGLVIPLSNAWKFELTKRWEFLFIVVMLISLFLMQFRRRDYSNAIVDISVTLFGVLYVSWLFSFIIKLRYLPQGAALVGALLLITKAGDIGAFLIGSRWGKTLMIKRISPKKTIQGAVGGFVFSLLASVAAIPLLGFTFIQVLILGVFLGAIGQIGDLCESLIKRDCQAKDSSTSIPGIGGVLDVIDSLLFTAPAFYFYINAINGV